MGAALEGLIVVDFTSELFASLAGGMLGDFGATVIRVEDLANPRKVDHDRDGMHPTERWNSLDELAHRNKQSLAVNLAEPAGREILGKLIAKADEKLVAARAKLDELEKAGESTAAALQKEVEALLREAQSLIQQGTSRLAELAGTSLPGGIKLPGQ